MFYIQSIPKLLVSKLDQISPSTYLYASLLFLILGLMIGFGVDKTVDYSGGFGPIITQAQESDISILPTIQHKPPTLSRSPNDMTIYIPSINLKHKIVANVDPNEESVYLPVIEQNIAHGKWTWLPNEVYQRQSGITYIFAHRDGSAGIFQNLGELKIGEDIYIFQDGRRFHYKVSQTQIVTPDRVDLYTSQSTTPLLRIQTCENGTKQRLILDAVMQD